MGDVVGRIVIEMMASLAKLQADVNTAKGLLQNFQSNVENIAGKIKGALAGIFAGLSIAAFVKMVDDFAEGAAKLTDTAAKAGTSVEKLSQIGSIAKLSGMSVEDLGGALAKLSKGLITQTGDTEGAGRALSFLGINARDASGKLKDSGVITEEVALRLATIKDGAAKTAIVMDLYGKSGANLIPVLKDIAEYGLKDASITEAQAKIAKEYTDDLVRLKIAKGALAKIISAELLPVADAIVKTMLQWQTASGGVRDQAKALAKDGSIREWAMAGVAAFGFILNAGDGVKRVFEALGEYIGFLVARAGNTLGGLATAARLFVEGEYKKAWQEVKDIGVRDSAMVAENAKRMQEIFDRPLLGDRFVADTAKNLALIDAKMKGSKDGATETGDGYAKIGAEAAKAAAAIAKAQADLDRVIAATAQSVAQARDAQAMANLEQQYKLGLVSIRDYYQQKIDLQQKGVDSAVAAAVQEYQALARELNVLDGLNLKGKEKAANDAKILEVQAKMEAAVGKVTIAELKQGEVERTKRDMGEALFQQQQAITKADIDRAAAIGKTIEALEKDIEKQRQANETIGLTKEQIAALTIARLEEQLAILKGRDGTELQVKALEIEISKRKELGALIAQGEQKQQSMQMWTDLANGAERFFTDLILHGKTAFDSLKNWAKEFLAQMIAIFAVKWVLNLAGMGSLASSIGGSTVAGAVANYFTGGAAGTAGAAGAAGAAGTAGGLSTATPVTGEYMATLQAYAPYLGWAAVAAVAAYLSASYHGQGWTNQGLDSKGNPLTGWAASVPDTKYRFLRAIGFSDKAADIMSGAPIIDRLIGHRARQNDAYGVRGTLSGGSITGTNWQDWSEAGGLFRSDRRGTYDASNTPSMALNTEQQDLFKDFTDSLKTTMAWLGNALHVDAATVLKDYTKDFNFQLNNNGQPLSDAEVSALWSGLFGSVLQDQVAMMFDAAGRDTISGYIRGLTGTGDEITQAISEFLATMDAAAKSGLKNLTPEALLAWAQQGETIGQTFNRIMTSWSQLEDAFTSPEVKLQAMRDQLNALFGDLASAGLDLPTTREEWLDVMRSIDLSTEAGRNLFTRMLALAPAFDQVSSAAQDAAAAALQAAASFAQSMQTSLNSIYGPGYEAAGNQAALNGLLAQFQGLNAWTAGMSLDQIMQALLTLVPGSDDANAYSNAGQGPLIARILQLFAALHPYNQGNGGGYGGASNQVDQFAQSLAEARLSLRQFIDAMVLDQQLSPLTTEQKFAFAKKQYEDTLWRAQNGDLNAMNNLQAITRQYLQLAQMLYASGPDYVAIWQAAVSNLGGVAGMTQDEINSRLAAALPVGSTMMSEATGQSISNGINALLDRISNGTLKVSDEGTNSSVNDLNTSVARGRAGGVLNPQPI